ncbi:MAG: glucose-6-phosphate dehydrogenase [Porphyromonas sp.]|nr:glucose-6-phosphate dehydrogenase [Bacteroidales bacterium]MDY3100821.1 glucose-6-phosphate dehydrogenase [Porphyromonas sp.]
MKEATAIPSAILPDALILVIFGGSGDLTKRKLMPSLYQLYRKGKMPSRFAIVGSGRSEYRDEDYQSYIAENLKKYLPDEEYDGSKAEEFVSHLRYYAMSPTDREEYPGFRQYLSIVDGEIENPGNYIFYLATPPELYGVIPQNLQTVDLNRGEAHGKETLRRIVIEKPFGTDLESALRLNNLYQGIFEEDQIFRMDHYLGKETAQNILALRFANGIFEPLWNRNYIERVEITAVENMGVEKRGGYYDHAGALRDMVQNHLSQLLALVAMEAPASFDAGSFRDEVVKVYRSMRKFSPEDIRKNVIRGQYVESHVGENTLKGYREEDKVDPESRTETFVALKVFLDNWRWEGVPFYIRTGKQMPTKVTEIVVHFKSAPHLIFGSSDGKAVPNTLTIRIAPNEGATLKFGMKVPGSGFEIKKVSMDFTYDKLGGVPTEDAYSRLLEDCMLGDPSLFTRSDAVEFSWRFYDPILKEWQKHNDEIPLYGYPARTWGPKESDRLLESGTSWTNPCRNLTDNDIYCEL